MGKRKSHRPNIWYRRLLCEVGAEVLTLQRQKIINLFFIISLFAIYFSTFTFQHLHFNIYISTFTFQHLHFNIYISTFTFQHLHFNIYISTFTFTVAVQHYPHKNVIHNRSYPTDNNPHIPSYQPCDSRWCLIYPQCLLTNTISQPIASM
jgi:hypothetical protein